MLCLSSLYVCLFPHVYADYLKLYHTLGPSLAPCNQLKVFQVEGLDVVFHKTQSTQGLLKLS